jgi:hypothetical protein
MRDSISRRIVEYHKPGITKRVQDSTKAEGRKTKTEKYIYLKSE